MRRVNTGLVEVQMPPVAVYPGHDVSLQVIILAVALHAQVEENQVNKLCPETPQCHMHTNACHAMVDLAESLNTLSIM